MRHGYCHIPLAPCRADASDKSEMVTQLLFGEHFEVLEKQEKWSKMRIAQDAYECWIDNKQYLTLFVDQFEELQRKKILRTSENMGRIMHQGNVMFVPIGSALPFFDKGTIKISNQEYSYNGAYNGQQHIAEIARVFLNAPYLWGGKSSMGIDCSGFTQVVFSVCGIQLPRDAYQQAEIGEVVDFMEEAQEGDLAFFDNEEGRIIHVGFILNDQRIILASGKVRIDKIDHEGIYNEDSKSYTHKLRLIKRVGN
ncbi:MAG TPA: hydrolase Nlp/P60 [Flavobacteriales bacterium]|nr:hydrolase Nlp/P60 [Flavobacteriales bacterium]